MEKNINEDYGVLVNISLAEQVAEQEKAIAELVEALDFAEKQIEEYEKMAGIEYERSGLVAKHKTHTKEEG